MRIYDTSPSPISVITSSSIERFPAAVSKCFASCMEHATFTASWRRNSALKMLATMKQRKNHDSCKKSGVSSKESGVGSSFLPEKSRNPVSVHHSCPKRWFKEIRCQIIILARKDEPTPDYPPLKRSISVTSLFPSSVITNN